MLHQSPESVLIIAVIANAFLSVAALISWRFRYRERIVYVQDLSQVSAEEAAEDLGGSLLCIFNSSGNLVAKSDPGNISGIDGRRLSATLKELVDLAGAAGLPTEHAYFQGQGAGATLVRLKSVGSMDVYALAMRRGRPPSREAVVKAASRTAPEILGAQHER